MRTLGEHLHHCDSIEDDEDGDEKSKEFGVNSHSILLQLKHFDMCSGTLIPDVMHDLLEGALQHIIKLLLCYLIEEKKYFSYSHLNQKIESMELGYMEDNHPSQISRSDKTLRQNGKLPVSICMGTNCALTDTSILLNSLASQTWTLGRLLPVIVGDKVPENDEHWQHYLSTLEIADLILAPEILPEEVACLKILITEHHTTFVHLYPDASVIPKMHYLIHVPRLMLK